MSLYFDANGNVRKLHITLTAGSLLTAYLFNFVVGISQVNEPGMHPLLTSSDTKFIADQHLSFS
jgi:hypothetical protein